MASKPLAVGLPVYIVAAVLAAGGGLFYFLQYSKPAASAEAPLTPEGKAYVHNLQLSDVNMKATESYMKQMIVEINGSIGNAGDRPLDTVEIYCVFYDRFGQLVLRKRVPIVNAKMGGLKPSEAKPFRLAFDDLPEDWNQTMPQLVIAAVTFS